MIYYFFKIFSFVVSILPYKFVVFIGFFMGNAIYYLLPFRKKVIKENLNKANLEYPLGVNKLIKKIYINLSLNFFDFFYFRGNGDKIAKYVEVENIETIKDLLENNKQFILLTAHFGNWELLAAFFSSNLRKLTAIAQRIHNKNFNKLVTEFRENSGMKILDRHKTRSIIEAVKYGESLLILFDQDAGEKGISSIFLGNSASTTKGFATLSLKYRLPIVTCFAYRTNDKHYISFGEILNPATYRKNEFIVQKANDILSEYIKKLPEQWFWVHKRWKTYGL